MVRAKRVKLWESASYLQRQYQVLKKTPAQIAQETGATERTIYTWLKKFGLIR